jgi:Cu-processing system permease protein
MIPQRRPWCLRPTCRNRLRTSGDPARHAVAPLVTFPPGRTGGGHASPRRLRLRLTRLRHSAADLLTIARLELQAAARMKWIRLLAIAFALMASAAAYAAGAAGELSGADGFERTTMTLVPIVLIVVPLAALVLGITGQSAESGGEPFLFAQPIDRATVLLGRWLGESAALTAAVAIGFAAGGAVVAFSSGTEGLLRFAFFVVASMYLGTIFLSLGAAIAASTEKRVTALGVGTFVWFFFVLLYDAAALSLAGWITGSLGGRVLFGSVFLNPADLIRIAMLSVSGTPDILGAAGDAWMRFLGGTTRASLVSAAALAAWTAAPLTAGIHLLRARDL